MNKKPYILPNPQTYEWNEAVVFPLYLCDGIVIDTQTIPAGQLLHPASVLKKSVEKLTALRIPVVTEKSCSSFGCKIWLSIQRTLAQDTYELSITENQISISGAGGHEVLWGVQTLRQLISQEGTLLHSTFIHDYPQIKHRGFYHDVTRGRIPDLKALKKLADRCSYYKINELQLYVEHSYLFRGCSEVWRDETPLTAQEIMDFDQYCRNVGIDLIPSISSFGHLYKMLGTKTFSPLCELENSADQPFSFGNRMSHHTLDASDPKALELMKSRIDEYMSLFSSKYFNICADETFDIGLGKTKQLVDRLGREEVYIRFVNELCRHVTSRGKIPMFWGDIIVSSPEKISALPEETICLNWGYAPDQDDSSVKAFDSVGAKQYVCPGVQGWNSFINVMPDAYENISRMCSYAHQYKTPGVLNTDWGDMGHPNHPDFSAFGLICGAAFSWNSRILSMEEIYRQVSVIEYGDRSGTIMDCISDISTKAIMNWTAAVLIKEDTQGLFENSSFVEYFRSYKTSMLASLTPEKYKTTNDRLAEEIRRLSSYLIRIPQVSRPTITCLIHAALGQSIFNTIALHLLYEKTPGEAPQSPTQTASQLETWFMAYKDFWRQQGKEADLYRLQEVIDWWGDYLRDL